MKFETIAYNPDPLGALTFDAWMRGETLITDTKTGGHVEIRGNDGQHKLV
jgi:hypothetical protein